MRTTVSRCKTRLPEEEAYRRFSEIFDLDTFALELGLNERIGTMILEGTRKALDARQRSFEVALMGHPTTLAENARRAGARCLEKERLRKIAENQNKREERRWRAKLAPAHAS